MHLEALIAILFAARLGPCFSFNNAQLLSQSLSSLANQGLGNQGLAKQRYAPGKHHDATRVNSHACVPLLLEKPERQVLASRTTACFTVGIGDGEAAKLLIDQPEDLEIHLIGHGVNRLIDGFDLGVETVTIAEAGIYRVEVRKVNPSPRPVAFSVVRWRIETRDASAWQQSEMWATRSKRTKKIEDIDRSLDLWKELGDSDAIARTYLKRGSALQSNNPEAARAEYERALELCLAHFDTRCSAEAENNSGWTSSRLGDLKGAQYRLEEAARDWYKLTDQLDSGRTLSNLGFILLQAGDFEHAISNLRQAAGILRSRDSIGYAKALNNLGLCYQALAEYERARPYFANAISRLIRGKTRIDLVRAEMNFGRNFMLAGDLRHAQPILERAAADAEKLSDLPTRSDTLKNLAQSLFQAGRLDEARSRLELALEADRFDGDRRGQGSALHFLGLIAQKTGDVATARNLITEAARVRQDVGLRDDAAESLYALAELEYHANYLDAARSAAEQALKLLESVRKQAPSATLKASYYSRKQQFFSLLVELAMTPENPQAASDGLLAAERGRARALMDLLAGGSVLQIPSELAARNADYHRQLDYLSSHLSKTSPDKDRNLQARFQQLLSEDEELEEEIRKAVGGQRLAQTLDSVERLQREYIPPDSALLEFHLGVRQSFLWLATPDVINVFRLPPAAVIQAEAAPVVYRFGRILERQSSSQKQAAFQKGLRRLSNTLLGQLRDVQLPHRLILVPDGILLRVPFAALSLPKASICLGLDHDLVQVPSAAYLTVGRHPSPIRQYPQTILAVADPVFSLSDRRVINHHRPPGQVDPGRDLGRLFFDAELKTADSLVPLSRRTTLRGFDASRVRLGQLHLENFGILHFSTHALIDDLSPELSWVALSMVDRNGRQVDGLLRPYQMAQFHLDGSTVVLSACDTALGKQVLGEGLVGLSNSLLYAGGSQLVLTLAAVDAEASSRFLSIVYRQFLPGANTMEHSLTMARRSMAHSRRFADPYYWAAFVVIGRPTDAANGDPAPVYNRR